MALFDWVRPNESTTSKAITDAVGDRFGPRATLRALEEAVPRYINNIDQGKLIYPACKRALSDPDGDARSAWDHTRLEAIRYVVMVPGREFELLIEPIRQLEMIDAYLVQRPHADTVIDFTGTTSTDFSIAVLAGLNWLRHCAQLAEVPLAEQSGALRKFRRVVTLAQRWRLSAETGCPRRVKRAVLVTSDFPASTDIFGAGRHVSKVPTSRHSRCQAMVIPEDQRQCRHALRPNAR